ncbi:Hypothetical protein PHPALM_38002 [Phytophthora palmivora]|uniref:DDE-1 domain-containing protein n=1 Tax=Phytophthora palmivora TaxID=4796 RepID=A0A2P4WW12_9STRA|nr:Hypothetical protein PHPALM_38002 [Phytophthora palmivora]
MSSRFPISIWRKQQVFQWIENEGGRVPTRAIRHFQAQGLKIDGGSVHRWWRNRELLPAANPSMCRLPGGCRRPLSASMEERLKKEKVTRSWIGYVAKVIYASQSHEHEAASNFIASPHWTTSFMRHYGLSLRRRTNLTTLSDDTLIDRAVSYMKFLQTAFPVMDLDRTILMDETVAYFEDARNQTVDLTGRRHVVVRSTGFSSMRITAVLAVSASGRKAKLTTFDKIDGVYVAYQPRAWVDSKLLKRWIDLAFHLIDMNEGKHLVWGSMRAHISKDVKAKCSVRNISMCVFPGGLTPYLQARDIAIYKTFKDLLYIEINAWKEGDKVEYTRFGNSRMPSVAVVCERVRTAWRDTDSRTVNNSIAFAGFADDNMERHVAQHDVYGEKFCEKWGDTDTTQEVSDIFNLDELHDTLDDTALVDE